ncbi:MAG: hypothetical protein GY866_03915 [Proteobacteria bacterium]|nr:hypothetical protein [Pseudomonadota bacterium]
MTNFSRFWRKNRSRHKATELALGLRALRKVTGHIGSSVKPVYWKGMAEANDHSILVDMQSIPEKFPISFKNFDLLVGKVVLEGLASVEWTDWVKDKTRKKAADVPETALPFLDAFLEAAEEVYVNELARPYVWSSYLKKFWETEMVETERDPVLPPSPASLAQIWKKKSILGQVPDHLHFYYDDPLEILDRYASPLRELAVLSTPGERRDKRIDLYLEIWSEMFEAISEWEIFHQNPEAVNMFDEDGPQADLPEDEDKNDSDQADDQEEDPEAGSLEPDLADEISSMLEEGEHDLTQDIAMAVQDPEAKSMETFFKRGSALMDVHPDAVQVSRLRRIFREQEAQIRRTRNKHIRRGLLEGKLDARRLYRVPIDGKTFKTKQAPGTDDLWQICIVADASASMAGKGGGRKPWGIAERTFAAITEAAKGFRNRIDIYAYNAEAKKCTLTKLYHGGRLYSVVPLGRTPSGQAIMAAAMVLDRKYKKSMIIHITDGAANCGLRLNDAVNYCLNSGVEVFTIGCGCTKQTRQFLRESFPPGCVYFMKSIDYLSAGMEYLFKRRILKRGT